MVLIDNTSFLKHPGDVKIAMVRQVMLMYNLLVFFTYHPLNKLILRHILTGSVDHASWLFKSNLVHDPIRPFCLNCEETAKHIFWECQRWSSTRNNYPILVRLFHLTGSLWPACYLNCGWIEYSVNYGFELLNDLEPPYTRTVFAFQTHHMYMTPTSLTVQPQAGVSPFSVSSG